MIEAIFKGGPVDGKRYALDRHTSYVFFQRWSRREWLARYVASLSELTPFGLIQYEYDGEIKKEDYERQFCTD